MMPSGRGTGDEATSEMDRSSVVALDVDLDLELDAMRLRVGVLGGASGARAAGNSDGDSSVEGKEDADPGFRGVVGAGRIELDSAVSTVWAASALTA